MTNSPAEHSNLAPSQDLGTLLMIVLQVNIQHPNTDPAMLQFGNAGRIVSAEFDRQLAWVEGKGNLDFPDLTKILIYTDKKLFRISVEELDG